MLISLKNIDKFFGDEKILDNICFDINEKERIGLVGVNGAGKSTLLNIITGKLYKDSGEIMKSKSLNIGYLNQNTLQNNNNKIIDEIKSVFKEVYEIKEKIDILQQQMNENIKDTDILDNLIKKYDRLNYLFEIKNGYEIEYKINNILNGLGFKGYNIENTINMLSGGEKVRLGLAKILLQEPDLLILDEPTNHLDFQMLEWLENYLLTYKGAVIVVSHDRYFLDKICTKIFEIENSKLNKYKGNYSDFLVQKEEKIKKQIIEYEKQQKEIEKLTEFINKNLSKSASVNGVGTRVKKLDKMVQIEKPIFQKKMILNFEYDYLPYKEVLNVTNLSINLGDKKIYDNVSLNIFRNEKIAIIGKNGVGKTTFLKAVLNKLSYEGKIKWGENVKISYFDQECKDIDLNKSVIDEIHDRFPNKTDLELRKLYAKLLITDDMVFKKIKELSGANRAKVVFAIMILEKANVLILDEPTNHLDYLAKEELTRALNEFQGTIIMVSHDRYLLNVIPTRIIEVENSKFNIYNGNYQYYLDNKIDNCKKSEKTCSKNREKNINIRNEKKKLESIERKIKKIENNIECLNNKLNDDNIKTDYVELTKIYNKKEEENKKLDVLMDEWIKLNENIEGN